MVIPPFVYSLLTHSFSRYPIVFFISLSPTLSPTPNLSNGRKKDREEKKKKKKKPEDRKLEKGRKNKKKVRKGRVKARDEKDDESLQTFTAAKCFIVALLYLIFYPTSALAP